MTREEAIQVLKGIMEEAGAYEEAVCYVGSDEDVEAIDMAIEALKQPLNEDWERYSDFLWKEAYERGKQDALKGGGTE